MKGYRFAGIPLVVVVMGLVAGARPAAAAESKEARGRVTGMSRDSMTVRVGDESLTFALGADTTVEAVGAGEATRLAQEAGAAGIKFGDFVQPGVPVLVTYREANGSNQALSVRVISSPGHGGRSVEREKAKASGTAKTTKRRDR